MGSDDRREMSIEDVEEAKKYLMRMDPEIALAAIQQSDVDLDEVNRIKDFLSKSDPGAVQIALAEIQEAVRSKEMNLATERLSKFSSKVLKVAAVELGMLANPAYCTTDGPDPGTCGKCIALMVVRCEQSMVMSSKYDQVSNPATSAMIEEALFNALSRLEAYK